MVNQNISKDLTHRVDLLKLVPKGGIAVELGVAEGEFSCELLSKKHLGYLYSVDMYAGDSGHDNAQYRRALMALMPYKEKSTLIKLRFDEAVTLFEDHCFDFIYVDGYAHNGEEGGQTFTDWLPKLKKGGVLAGHDYVTEYPLVIEAVDRFVKAHDFSLTLINDKDAGWNNGNTSWFIVKK